ncbi:MULTISPECIES: NAD(P)H-dependent oxidoreductase subunit E [Cetobacterium]|jgi:NADH:ubiquinone oxidoreductase subunit E|uniref:NAD(P)H-dependent oxidoreductase subunit E n=1 Tax=Candidatus Cetobacterium colombiensis TaxID=3073100 RepID=A0ABU4WAX3_9FUSO|nr:NAD(P)H-dependent oxidoreductase subunit E [Candidatus Cetobacterium colombiensis]MDX8336305.1 NAD(P)H-dependent oxidoreductase subunit E [Candidatus Cetobacterium colombiensis]
MKGFYEKLDVYIDELENKKDDYKVLSFVLDELGYLPDDVLAYVSKKLDIFPFSLEGTIKFYPKLQKARVKHYVQICVGRNCNQPGLKEKLNELREKINFPIEERHCLGRCAKASNLKVNEEYYSYKTLEDLEKLLLNLK